MITRRTLLKTAAAAAATTVFPAPAIAQGTKKITFLTWNIIDQKELIEGWIKRFQATRPGVEVEWLDKKGPEFSPFYQTQLTAGTVRSEASSSVCGLQLVVPVLAGQIRSLLAGPRPQDALPVNLLIAKQRNGPTGDVNLTFFKSYTRFETAAKVSDQDVPT